MNIQKRVKGILSKVGAYKYAALVLLLGIGLMLIPQGEKTPEEPAMITTKTDTSDLEQRLEAALSQMQGVGTAKVLLTLESGMTYQYQTDEQIHRRPDDLELDRQTVLTEDNSGREVPVTVKTTYPAYKGALVLCQGADSAAVRLNVVHAVSALTGLGSDKISVIKMKDN